MSDDIQMDVEPAQPLVAQAHGHPQEPVLSNPFFQWKAAPDFGASSQNPADHSLAASTMDGFGQAMMPPGVSASDSMHEGMLNFEKFRRYSLASHLLPSVSLLIWTGPLTCSFV
ncbi:hypothetical protein M408DRAFT_198237 [Serendipita vermifera MAFF 305830]|uniref:Uncharacterized protein n=1 Tax=Serendipita vermifera MAFF 305830 TaxID=933852 RepID=A0A0C3B3B1_SERVB|nr:hypothetical protein M408DRAFT_198237 [Serendipita vermifera MAFF 305830]